MFTGILTTPLHRILSWLWSLSYRNQSISLLSKTMDWFLYNRYLCHERVNHDDSRIIVIITQYSCSLHEQKKVELRLYWGGNLLLNVFVQYRGTTLWVNTCSKQKWAHWTMSRDVVLGSLRLLLMLPIVDFGWKALPIFANCSILDTCRYLI